MKQQLNSAFSEKERAQITKRFQVINKKEITKKQFKESLGIMGQDHATFLLDRLFNVITQKETISLQQYLNYLQVAMYGNEEEKAQMSFKFMDLHRQGFLEYKDFQQMLIDLILFWNTITGSRVTPRQSYIRNLWDQFDCDKLDFKIYLNKYEQIFELVDWFEFFHQPKEDTQLRNTKYQEELTKQQLTFDLVDNFQGEIRNCVNLLAEHEKSKILDESMVQGPCNFSTSQIAKDGDEDPSFEISFLSKLQSTSECYHINQSESYLDQIQSRINHLLQIVESTLAYSPTQQHSCRTVNRQSLFRRRATIKLVPKSNAKSKLSVYFGHENWNLILNLMIGMSKSVLSIQPEFYSLKVLKNEFTDRYIHDVVSSRTNSFDYRKAFLFKDYAPTIFLRIRRKYGITDYGRSVGPENLVGNLLFGKLNSLTELGSSGKSGSFFYYTSDCNYMIKTISTDEAILLRKLLPRYFQHMISNKNTLISRIFGFHQLKIQKSKNEFQKIYLVSIVNIFRAGLELDFKYDLKGSLYGRQRSEQDEQGPLKDLDMLSKKDYICLEQQDKELILRTIEEDVKFLKESEIIDYSLLIGYHKRSKDRIDQYGCYVSNSDIFYESFEGGLLSDDKQWIYYIGIIDTLTYFNTKKVFEYELKSTLISSDISCIPPLRYAQRFINFIKSNVLQPSYVNN